MLRRAMGKKIKEEMDKHRPKFVNGAMDRGVDRKTATHVFEVLEKFASYGFNKSHAAAYALIAYQTAYLKAHYPVAFMTALMHLDVDNPDKLAIFKQNSNEMGIEVLPPNANKSLANFAVEKQENGADVIRYPLGAIKGVGVGAMKSLVNERKENGNFKDIFDLVERVGDKGCNKKQLEGLTYAGALDDIHPNRAQLIESMEILGKYASTYSHEKNSNQVSLFGGQDIKLETPKLPLIQPWSNSEKLEYEFKAVGMYLSSHPLDLYNKTLQSMEVIKYADVLKEVKDTGKNYVKLAGIITSKSIKTSRRGNKFAFIGLSDSSGSYEITLFSDALENSKDILEVGNLVVIPATADIDEDNLKLRGAAVKDLAKEMVNATKSIKVFVEDKKSITNIHNILKDIPKGKIKVNIIISTSDFSKQVEISIGGFNLIPNKIDEIRVLEGINKVEDFS
jgi:DNA polymerase-3 subunit alpha